MATHATDSQSDVESTGSSDSLENHPLHNSFHLIFAGRLFERTFPSYQQLVRHKRTNWAKWRPTFENATAPPNSYVERLPNELWIDILKRVRRGTAPVDYLDHLTCCKLWMKLGLPFLYKDVFFPDRCLKSFWEMFPLHHLSHIESLTISMKIDATEVLWLLQAIFPRLVRLKTFSLHASEDAFCVLDWARYFPVPILTKHPRKTMAFTQKWVTMLLDALPRGVINLDLDLAEHKLVNCDRSQTVFPPFGKPLPPNTHLCAALQGILPQLHRLRLRIPNLCPIAFGINVVGPQIQFPQLRQVFIEIPHPEFGIFTCCCHVLPWAFDWLVLPNELGLLSVVMLREIRPKIEQGFFPRLQSFVVVKKSSNGRGSDTLNVLDLVANMFTTTRFQANDVDLGAPNIYSPTHLTTVNVMHPGFVRTVHANRGFPLRRLTMTPHRSRMVRFQIEGEMPTPPGLGDWYTTETGVRLPGIHEDYEYEDSVLWFLETFADLVPGPEEPQTVLATGRYIWRNGEMVFDNQEEGIKHAYGCPRYQIEQLLVGERQRIRFLPPTSETTTDA